MKMHNLLVQRITEKTRLKISFSEMIALEWSNPTNRHKREVIGTVHGFPSAERKGCWETRLREAKLALGACGKDSFDHCNLSSPVRFSASPTSSGILLRQKIKNAFLQTPATCRDHLLIKSNIKIHSHIVSITDGSLPNRRAGHAQPLQVSGKIHCKQIWRHLYS